MSADEKIDLHFRRFMLVLFQSRDMAAARHVQTFLGEGAQAKERGTHAKIIHNHE